jgi:hypothetical protein
MYCLLILLWLLVQERKLPSSAPQDPFAWWYNDVHEKVQYPRKWTVKSEWKDTFVLEEAKKATKEKY